MSDLAPVKILVVDDLPEKHVVYRALLEEPSQELVSAMSGEEALKALLHDEFAVILLDINMPGMDGFETASLIRARKNSRHTPIIFITAFPDEMFALKGYALGAVDYILAPVASDILRTKVGVFVQLFRLREQVKRQAADRVALAEGEQARLSEILENAADFVARADSKGQLTHVNRAGRRILGWGADETGVDALIGQRDKAVLAEGLAQAHRDGMWFGESTLHHRTGTAVPVSQLILAHKSVAGRVESFSIIARDISDRKRADETKARLVSIVESSEDAIVSKDLTGVITSWNRGAERLFGYPAEEVVGRSITVLIPPERLGEEDEILACIHRGEAVDHYETIRRRKDGSLLDISLTVSPLRDDQGKVIGASKIARDITEQKRTEQGLRDREERLRSIVETAVDSIIVIDDRGMIDSFNPAAERIFGYRAEEVIGRNVKVLMPPPFSNEHDGYIANFLNTGVRKIIGIGREVTGLRKDGTTFPLELAVSEMFVGGRRMFTGIVRDITERRQAEDEIRDLVAERTNLLESERVARAEAERLGRLKDEFLATLSHELRTPLNAILGWAKLLQGPRTTAEDIAEGLEVIARNAQAQARLVDELLDMNRIVSGKLQINFSEVDLIDVVTQALETVQPSAKAKQVELSLAPGVKAARIMGDANRLQQVAWNLLTNAVKFTPKAGRVTVEVAPAERGFALTVKDSGEGISPEFMPYLFDRFRQADAGSARRHGGLGLGLAIVKQLVELHGGTIEAHSEGQNQGAVFTVLLPERTVPPSAAAAPQAPVAEAAEDPEFTVEEAFLRGVRILLVDDEPDSINVARRVLEECEAHVDVAASAKEAYEQVRNKHPHIVISDIGMPIEDGYSLMQRIRQAQNGSQAIRGIALTAFARPDDRKRALDAGYTAHLTKPVDPAELIRVVAKVADRAALAVNEKNA